MNIGGYNNYLIYKDGRVFSKKKSIFLKPNIGTTGYYYVKLYKEDWRDKHVMKKIHRLVAEHYIPKIEGYDVVDHKDRNRLNNDISNLRWVTQKINSHNSSKPINNKSGYKNISWDKTHNRWLFRKTIRGKIKCRYFHNKIDAMCLKFIYSLKH